MYVYESYSLFFIVLGRVHEIQIVGFFFFFFFFFGQILVLIFNDFSKSLLVRIYYFWKIGFQFTKLSASLLYSHLLYLRKGSEFREKTAKNFSNFNYVYGLGGFDLKFKFKELYVILNSVSDSKHLETSDWLTLSWLSSQSDVSKIQGKIIVKKKLQRSALL